jgi:hypothetical protein
VEVSRRPAAKRAKASPRRVVPSKLAPPPLKSGLAKKIGSLKISQPKVRARLRGTLEIELALAKLVGVSKKFHLLDVVGSSHEPHAAGIVRTHAAQVLTFNNLGDDSSPDVRKTPSPVKTIERCASPPPLVSGEFLCFGFDFVTAGPNNYFTGATQPPPSIDLPSSCKFYLAFSFTCCCAHFDRLFYFACACTIWKAA